MGVFTMESLWSRLPAEILEMKILPFLPIASLCRFRSVCKKWMALISRDRDFASAHGRASSPEEHVLLTLRAEEPFVTMEGREVLDVANNKVFTIKDNFLENYVKQMCGADVDEWNRRKILATDGGLFFLMYTEEIDHPLYLPEQVLLVCNPILKTAKLLPPSPGYIDSYESVVMSTDMISMEYEIVIFHVADYHFQTNFRDIYESQTGRWRRDVNSILPAPYPPRDSGRYWYRGSVFVKKLNEFYRLVRIQGQDEPALVSYDEITGVASDLGFHLPVIGDAMDLVVSTDRLFCVVRMGGQFYDVRSIKIFEVSLANKECIECVEIPSNLLRWVLGYDVYNREIERVIDAYEEPIVATGCASSILFCSCIGRSLGYNLLKKTWQRYPDNKILQARENFTDQDHPGYQKLYCSNYCPSLCAP